MQIASQFKYLQAQHRKGFFFSDFSKLNEPNLLSLEYDIQTAVKDNRFEDAVKAA